jgi:hypothetical protein
LRDKSSHPLYLGSPFFKKTLDNEAQDKETH